MISKKIKTFSPNGIVKFQVAYDFLQQQLDFKWKHLKVDSHLKVSILSGLVPHDQIWFSPYLQEDHNCFMAQIAVFFDVFHRKESLENDANLTGLLEMDETNPTHVVKEITYGANFIIIFEKPVSSIQDKDDSESQMFIEIRQVMNEILLDKINQLSPENYTFLSNSTSCRVFSSLKREDPVSISFPDCICLLQRDLSPANWQNFIPIEIVLHQFPAGIQTTIRCVTDHDVFANLSMLNSSMFELKNRSSKLLRHPTLSLVPNLSDRLKEFDRCINVLEGKLLKKMRTELIACRRGEQTVLKMTENLSNFYDLFFYRGKLMQWLLERQRELAIMKNLLAGIPLVFIPEAHLNLLAIQSMEIFVFQTVRSEDPLISKFKNRLHLPGGTNLWVNFKITSATSHKIQDLRQKLSDFLEKNRHAPSNRLVLLSTSETQEDGHITIVNSPYLRAESSPSKKRTVSVDANLSTAKRNILTEEDRTVAVSNQSKKLPMAPSSDKILFDQRAELYRFDGREWKERGVGQLKLLKNTTTNQVRLVLRQDQVINKSYFISFMFY